MMKGSFVLGPETDVPVLLAVLDAGYIDTKLLYEECVDAGIVRSKGAFYCRLKKLLTHSLVRQVKVVSSAFAVYSVTERGVQELSYLHKCPRSITPSGRKNSNPMSVHHSLQVNQIRAFFRREFAATGMISELGIRESRMSESGEERLAKEYDLLFSLPRQRFGKRPLTVALELERTPKALDRWRQIGEILEQETVVDLVIYVAADSEMVAALADVIHPDAVTVAFTTIGNLLSSGPEFNVVIRTEWGLTAMPFLDLINRFE